MYRSQLLCHTAVNSVVSRLAPGLWSTTVLGLYRQDIVPAVYSRGCNGLWAGNLNLGERCSSYGSSLIWNQLFLDSVNTTHVTSHHGSCPPVNRLDSEMPEMSLSIKKGPDERVWAASIHMSRNSYLPRLLSLYRTEVLNEGDVPHPQTKGIIGNV